PVAPAPPPPTFPSGPSNFPPVASFYPPAAPPPAGASTAPPVRLLPPETAAPPAGLSESSSSPAAAAPPALPSRLPDFPPGTPDLPAAIPDRVANGRKPALAGLDWLKANGYKAALCLRPPGASDAADRKQFEQRGLAFTSLEVSPATLSAATLAAFARVVN